MRVHGGTWERMGAHGGTWERMGAHGGQNMPPPPPLRTLGQCRHLNLKACQLRLECALGGGGEGAAVALHAAAHVPQGMAAGKGGRGVGGRGSYGEAEASQ